MSSPDVANKIAIGLSIGIAVVMIILAVAANCGYRKAMPDYPELKGAPTDSIKANIANYKALSEVVEKEETFLYDLIVVKVLQPLFVVLIGVVAGLRLLKALSNKANVRQSQGK